MDRRLRLLAFSGAIALALPAVAAAWTPSSYFYGARRTASSGGFSYSTYQDGFSTGGDCDPQPAYVETSSDAGEEDTRTFATVRHVRKVIPRQRVNYEHVTHNLNRVHHVVHDVNQDVYIKNVRVHHNVTRDQTVHHYRHHTNYIEQDEDVNVYHNETLPEQVESDCEPGAGD
ncbi:MAG: hypothetical protein HYY25_01660 [Candidatus Wallbacteria bacterium]|nr:hypothetical protein [Candidatus Wallbacteria bacterium]